jgi:hypothetical protein
VFSYFFSGAVLTLHLPPESDVAPPEIVRACREPTCATATLTPSGPSEVAFSVQGVSGMTSLDPGNVRKLEISWMVNDVPKSNPHDMYDVTVTDADGNATGGLSGTVTYAESMPNGDGCGSTWNATLSD